MTEAEKIHQIWSILGPFTVEMRAQLTSKKNLQKSHWRDLGGEECLRLLDTQVMKFNKALARTNAAEVQDCAVAVATTAMLIADTWKENQ